MDPLMCEKRGAITRYTDALDLTRQIISQLKTITDIARASDLEVQSPETMMNLIDIVGDLSDKADFQMHSITEKFEKIRKFAQEGSVSAD